MKNLGDNVFGALLIIFGLAAQTTFLSFGVSTPDLVLAVVIAFGLTRGPLTGAAFGFGGGMAEGLVYGDALGLAAILMTIAGYVVGFFGRNVRTEGIPLGIGVAFLTQLSYQFLHGFGLFLFGTAISGSVFFGAMLWQPALLATVAFVPLFVLQRSVAPAVSPEGWS